MISSLLAQTRTFDPNRGEVGTGDYSGVPTLKGMEALFSNFTTLALAFGGVVLFILLIMGGLKYITAGGDPKALEGAKKTITSAIAGIVVLALAYLILVLIQRLTGAPITDFKIVG